LKVNSTIANRIACAKCLDVIESKHTHDFVGCSCESVYVDGGNEYWKRSGEYQDIIDLSLYQKETGESNMHLFSGWPGAYCLKCGAEDVMEIWLADEKVVFGENGEVEFQFNSPEEKLEFYKAMICPILSKKEGV
jgi:hypothetical protein